MATEGKGDGGVQYYGGSVSFVSTHFEWREESSNAQCVKVRGARVGCNPVGYFFPDIITEYDEKVVEWAIREGIDIYSQSFVCHPIDAFHLRCILGRKSIVVGNNEADAIKFALHQHIIGKIQFRQIIHIKSSQKCCPASGTKSYYIAFCRPDSSQLRGRHAQQVRMSLSPRASVAGPQLSSIR